MITRLIKRKEGFYIDHVYLKEPFCVDRREAEEKLKTIGIENTEIVDAFAAMTAHGTDAAEFGVFNTFIRPFNTKNKSERT